MAGPRAPIGSLKQHASRSAQLARNETGTLSRSVRASAKKHKKAGRVEDEESDSSSDSDSSNDGDDAPDGTEDLLQIAASRSSPLKHKAKQTVNGLSKMSTTTAKTPTQAPPSERKTGASVVKKETTSEDSSAESESDSSSETSSDSESESKESQAEHSKPGEPADVPKNMKKAGGPIPKEESESESSSSESESESESEAEETTQPTLKKADSKTKKEKIQKLPKKETSSEDATSDEEGGAEVDGAANTKGASSGESDSSEAEDGSSGSEDESGSDEEADESMALDMRKDGMADARVPEIIGNDFHLRKAGEGADASDVSQVFAQAKMEGKQVWYFTAPASIPIEVVEKLEIPLERAQQGLSILSHSGDDYGVAFEDASTSRSIKLLIPNKAGDKYGMMNRPVDQAMHLKRITQFSAGNEKSTSFTQTHSTTRRPARPQPEGLKARYNPIGVSNASMGKIGADASSESDEDVEMAQAPPLPPSQVTPGKPKDPKLVQTPKSEKKRKRKHATDEEPPSSQPTGTSRSGQKAKKARVASSESTSAAKAVKVTPVAPPYPAANGASAKKELATPSRKESAVPLPANFRRLSQSQPMLDPGVRSSLAKESEKADKKERKGKGKGKSKGGDGIKREKSAPALATTTPSRATKTSPIPPPFPGGQRQP